MQLIHNNLENTQIKKATVINLVDTFDYVPDSLVMKFILKKITGSICSFSFDSMEDFKGKISPFDTFIECIEGRAEVIIDEKSELIKEGQFIIIPAHSKNTIKAKEPFKMLSVIIKSGYEDVS